MRTGITGMAAAWLALLGACAPQRAPDGWRLGLEGGLANFVFDGQETVVARGVELQCGERTRAHLTPVVGLWGADDGAFLAWGGVRRTFWLHERLALTPEAGAGYFDDGEELELSYPLEFRLALEAAVRLPGDWRLGAAFVHLSNANLGPPNLGTEMVVLTLSLPLGRRSR